MASLIQSIQFFTINCVVEYKPHLGFLVSLMFLSGTVFFSLLGHTVAIKLALLLET